MSTNNKSAATGNVTEYKTRSEKLPTRVEQVTRDWLTRTLQLRYPDLVVEDMKVVDVISSHTTKLRLELEFNAAGQQCGIPKQVCLKANLSGDPLSSDACKVEAQFYRHIRDDIGVPAPECYFADWDEADAATGEHPQGLVILEDLIVEGGTFGHSTRPISIDGARKALDGFAALHAGLWDSAKLQKLSWLNISMSEDAPDADLFNHLSKYMYLNLENPEFRKLLPQWLLDDPEHLGRAFKLLVAHQRRETMPRCVIHGDSHLGNSYFRKDGTRIFIDFQLITAGHPWRDLTYFLVGSLTVEDRRKAERELLQHYLDRLEAHGAGGRLSFEKLWAEYQVWPMWGMVAWITNLDKWGQTTMPSVERFYTAAADHDTLRRLEAE